MWCKAWCAENATSRDRVEVYARVEGGDVGERKNDTDTGAVEDIDEGVEGCRRKLERSVTKVFIADRACLTSVSTRSPLTLSSYSIKGGGDEVEGVRRGRVERVMWWREWRTC